MAKVGHSEEVEEVVQAAKVGAEGPFGVGTLADDCLGWPQVGLAVALVLFSWLLQQFGLIGLQVLISTVVKPEWSIERIVVRPKSTTRFV